MDRNALQISLESDFMHKETKRSIKKTWRKGVKNCFVFASEPYFAWHFVKIIEHLCGWSYILSLQCAFQFLHHTSLLECCCVKWHPKNHSDSIKLSEEQHRGYQKMTKAEEEGRQGNHVDHIKEGQCMWKGYEWRDGVHWSVYLEAKVWGERPIMACVNVS